MRLRDTGRPWPRKLRVDCKSDAAAALIARFGGSPSGDGDVDAVTVELIAGDQPREGYAIDLFEDRIVVAASEDAGFRHAATTLGELAAMGGYRIGRIVDAPSLSIRGFHLNFESYRRMGIDEAHRLLTAAAKFKLNAILVEYGPRFPYAEHPWVCDRALARGDGGARQGAAAARGLSVIPLQPSLAHMDYVLRHDRVGHLRERPDRANLMCPTHEESRRLAAALLSEVMDLHPLGRFVHIGGDEARKIGACDRCREAVRAQGVGGVIGEFLGRLARLVVERGKRPIVWDDTLCAHPDALAHLPKETIIQYWDYLAVADPTPVLIPRMAHARYGAPRVAHDWSWAVTGKAGRLSDVQRAVIRRYSRPSRLRRALGKDFLAKFRRYLGDGFPRWMTALPYIEFYQDRGFDVITSPTGMGNGDMTDGTPNFARFERNIITHAGRCRRNGKALGIITTAWYDMPPEMLYQPLIRTAMAAW
jgi:hypothetical protein